MINNQLIKLKTNYYLKTLIALICMFALFCLIVKTKEAYKYDTDEPTIMINIKENNFNLKMALDPQTRMRGLSGISFLSHDEGMIFVYKKPSPLSFWMYNCLIDIDIIFLDCNDTVLNVREMKKEPSRDSDENEADYRRRLPVYKSEVEGCFAIELAAGSIERLKVNKGDNIVFDYHHLINRAE